MKYVIKMTNKGNKVSHYLRVKNDKISLCVYSKDAITFPTIKQAKMWFDLNHKKEIHGHFEIKYISI